MATNDLLPFGTGVGANVLDQASYSALSGRSSGFSAGTAVSAQFNKVWRQSSFTSSMIGQFTADYSGNNVVDDGNVAAYEANFVLGLKGALRGYFLYSPPGNPTLYVRTDGNDANDGSANTAAKAFATIQGALNAALSTLNLTGKTLTIQLGNTGTYSSGANSTIIPAFSGSVTVRGDPANQSAYVITGATGFQQSVIASFGQTQVIGVTIAVASSTGYGFNAAAPACGLTNVSFVSSVAGAAFVIAGGGGSVGIGNGCIINGNMGVALDAGQSGSISIGAGITLTVLNNPTFSTCFARAYNCGTLIFAGNPISGTATGTRYTVFLNGVINTQGGGANVFPGTVAGTTATGGQYA